MMDGTGRGYSELASFLFLVDSTRLIDYLNQTDPLFEILNPPLFLYLSSCFQVASRASSSVTTDVYRVRSSATAGPTVWTAATNSDVPSQVITIDSFLFKLVPFTNRIIRVISKREKRVYCCCCFIWPECGGKTTPTQWVT